mgnify:CR=1 FL=1
MKKALKPFKQFLGDHLPDRNNDIPLFVHPSVIMDSFDNSKSKFFYNCLVENKSSIPTRGEQYWCDILNCEDVTFKGVYQKKLKRVTDMKLAEFNFKVLHKILPCNSNLKSWKCKPNSDCDICKVTEDIPHLLFYCNFARMIWNELKDKCSINVDIRDIVLGDKLNDIDNFIVCSVSYFIYKRWLKNSFDNVPRENTTAMLLLKSYLNYTHDVYFHLKKFNLCLRLQHIISCL